MKEKLLNIIIAHAPDNPIKSAVLEEYLGIPGTQVRELVSALRLEGEPICSSSLGYFYSTERKYVERTIQSMRSRISKMTKAVNAMESKFEVDGQMKLF